MVHSRVRVMGEQLNPLLTVLPLGVLGSAVLSDLGALMSGVEFFGQVAHWDMAAGLIVGLLALSVLLVDLITAPPETHARRVLAKVSAGSCAMVFLFAVVWTVRAEGNATGSAWLLLVELLALGLGVTGAWLARGWVVDRGLPERIAKRALPERVAVPGPLALPWTYGQPER